MGGPLTPASADTAAHDGILARAALVPTIPTPAAKNDRLFMRSTIQNRLQTFPIP